jgi:lactate 2-monooxygenase
VSQPLESYQEEIYLNGLTWAVPPYPADLSALEAAAREVMTARAFGYVAGAAGSGDTASENLDAFRRWRIVPRMLTDVSTPSFASTVLGTELTSPFLLAPVGVLGIAHPEGESAVARAALAAGVPMILSTAA